MKTLIVALAVSVGAAGGAWAQGDPMGMARVAAANQLGVLEYCHVHGDVGPEALEAQGAAIRRLPAGSEDVNAAEATGRQGMILAPNGMKTSMDDMAQRGGTTVPDLCKRMGAAVVQANAAAGAAPQMPSGMPAMPTMPGGMTAVPGLPPSGSVPAMPATPGGMTAVPGMPAQR